MTTALSSYQYYLAEDGMRTAATEVVDYNTTIVNWSYDNLNRLITEDYNATGDGNDFVHDYEYDFVGNRLSRYVTSGDGNDTYYIYDANNDQLLSETTGANTISYGYDENGSTILKDAGAEPNSYYTYDYRNRLSQLTVEDGNTVDFYYNPQGIRNKAKVDDVTTKYLIDPFNPTGYAQVLKEIGPIDTVYVLGHDIIAQAVGSSVNYYNYDGHGSVRHLSNTSGALVQSAKYNYDAYGDGRRR